MRKIKGSSLATYSKVDKNTNILIVYLGVHKNFYGRNHKKKIL